MSSIRISADAFFVARVPRLPLSWLERLPLDPEQRYEFLASWTGQPTVLEALYLASPSLVERLPLWHREPHSKQGRRISHALIKYLIRMATRPTPFGLFAGIAVGRVAEANILQCGNADMDRRVTRLDMHYITAARSALVADQRAARGLGVSVGFCVNETLHRVGDEVHYIEPYASATGRHYRLSSVPVHGELMSIIEMARQRKGLDDLSQQFVEFYPEASVDDVRRYIRQLIRASLLLPDVPLPLTGARADESFASALSGLGATQAAKTLKSALDGVAARDSNGSTMRSGADISEYKRIAKGLEALPFEVTESKLFQTDLVRAFDHCELSQATGQTLARQLAILARAMGGHESPLKDYIVRFNRRFEGQMVPLLQLLNEECGLPLLPRKGYPSELLAGLRLRSPGRATATAAAAAVPSVLERMITAALTLPSQAGQEVIHLNSADIEERLLAESEEEPPVKLPRSFAAHVELYRDAGSGLVMFLNGCYGPSAANLLGRFCHLDETLCDKVMSHLRKEEAHSPDVLFAEVVHLPDGRPGNVIARPHLRDYEIVFMGESSLPEARQIEVRDLRVFVEGGQLKLWSERLQRCVVPRISSAHNYAAAGSLGIYRFLGMLQQQNATVPRFRLPRMFQRAAFVPRIMMDNLVLAPKTWRVPRYRIEALVHDEQWNGAAWLELSNEFHLGRHVKYAHRDNVLTLDLMNPVMVEILLAETTGKREVELSECLNRAFEPLASAKSACGERERYANEVIWPFLNNDAPVESGRTQPSHADIVTTQRIFAPGSRWMSLKLYGARSSVENALVSALPRLLEQHTSHYDRWFFMRYGDPDWHVRLRFHGDPEALYGRLLPALQESFKTDLESGLLHRLELFTYTREIERYGGDFGIELAEALFWHESRLVLAGLQRVRSDGESCRWRLALMACDALMDAFMYDRDRKFALVERLRTAFGREVDDNRALRTQLGEKYRKLGGTIARDIDRDYGGERTADNPLSVELGRCIASYRKAIAPIAEQFLQLAERNKLSCPINDLLSSMLHMLNNRMFKADGREHELVVYDLLRRHYLASNQRMASASGGNVRA